jgi:hypothetical protein
MKIRVEYKMIIITFPTIQNSLNYSALYILKTHFRNTFDWIEKYSVNNKTLVSR